jgi:hypothetical protein
MNSYEKTLEDRIEQLQKKLEETEKQLDDTQKDLRVDEAIIKQTQRSMKSRYNLYSEAIKQNTNDSRVDTLRFCVNALICIWDEAFPSEVNIDDNG